MMWSLITGKIIFKLKAIDGNLLAEEIDFNCYHVGTIESLNNKS